MAREIYNLHFPYAERNAMKKQLRINEMIFTINTSLWDECGDEIPVYCKFWINRKEQQITMQELDGVSVPIPVEFPVPMMTKLLKWMIHSLEIFCWDKDYCSPATNNTTEDDFDSLEFLGIEEKPADENFDEREPTWSVWLKYADGHEQDIVCHEYELPSRVEELFVELAEHFPMSFGEEDNSFLSNVYDCADLIDLKELVAELLREADETGADESIAIVWRDLIREAQSNRESAAKGKRAYHTHSGSVACVQFFLSYIMQTHNASMVGKQTGKQCLAGFVQYVEENIFLPVGELISISEIDKTMNAIDKKYKLISHLFEQEKLIILRIGCSHKTYNSICNAVRTSEEPPIFHYELYLFHGKNADVGHPVYIFLHELGHILQTEVTKDPRRVPESFLKLSDIATGKKLEQGGLAPELFADAFAMAMMQTFDWKEYDPFQEIAPELKNAFQHYMDWLIEKLLTEKLAEMLVKE